MYEFGESDLKMTISRKSRLKASNDRTKVLLDDGGVFEVAHDQASAA
jgi:hypothetical protein